MAYALADFGSYHAGGRIARVTRGAPRQIAFTREASHLYDPRGHFAVGAAYVQWFRPAGPRDAPPVVLVHGGGMHGGTWETTPDGRPGWLHGLLDMGREVHVVDMAERGRAGFAPGHWEGEPILRSLEEAWTLFRIGPAAGFAARRPYPGSLFPARALEALGARFCPRWLTTGEMQRAALEAVLDRTGPAELVVHSQGAEAAFDLEAARPGLFAALRAVEPSSRPPGGGMAGGAPLTILTGDFLDTDADWQARAEGWRAIPGAQVRDAAAEIAPGFTHLPMMDLRSPDALALLMEG